MEILILVVVGIIQILLIIAIFNIRTNIEKQNAINVAMVRLIAKIANNTGSDRLETKDVLDNLSKKL